MWAWSSSRATRRARLAEALGAAQLEIPVAHVEAGLRSHDRRNPWPEEDFRIAIDALASLLFAPTELNAANLHREAVCGAIHVTGNTGIDALVDRMLLLQASVEGRVGKRKILVTCHRRESWGEGLVGIATCLVELGRRGDVEIELVLYPNPAVAGEMRRISADHAYVDSVLREGGERAGVKAEATMKTVREIVGLLGG